MDSSDPEVGIEKHRSLKKRRTAFFKQFFIDYTQSTTLHGLKYTTEKGINTIEKIFWVITFTLSLGMCIMLIRNVWYKWQTSPVIVSFSEKVVPVEMVPFPSLTICPQIKAKASFYNYTEEMTTKLKKRKLPTNDNSTTMEPTDDPSEEDIKIFQDISLICPLPNYMHPIEFDEFPIVTNVSTIDNIVQVSPELDDYLFECRMLGDVISCSDIFNTVLTKEGICFNFNGLAAYEIFRLDNIQKDFSYNDAKKQSSGWDLNVGYNDNEGDYLNQYPRRGQYGSHGPYLEVIFKTAKEDYDQNCNVLNKGYKLYTEHPASQPQSSVYSYAVLPGQVSALALIVSMINTSEKLMKYDSKIRQCFFSTEKYLQYFKSYTASNCMLECMSNYTYEKCRCVPFYMPYSDSKHICTMQQKKCLKEVIGFKKNLIQYTQKCNCLPNCNSVTYTAEILKTEFNMEKYFINRFQEYFADDGDINELLYNYLSSFEYSKLEVYFRDSGFVTITRSELYGITDFLANIGGLLGLFLGFSFLSIVEIVYFFTFRLGFFCAKDIKKETDTQHFSETKHEENNICSIKVKHI